MPISKGKQISSAKLEEHSACTSTSDSYVKAVAERSVTESNGLSTSRGALFVRSHLQSTLSSGIFEILWLTPVQQKGVSHWECHRLPRRQHKWERLIEDGPSEQRMQWWIADIHRLEKASIGGIDP